MRGKVNVGGKILEDYSIFETGRVTNSKKVVKPSEFGVDISKYQFAEKAPHSNYFIYAPIKKYSILGDYPLKAVKYNSENGNIEFSHDIPLSNISAEFIYINRYSNVSNNPNIIKITGGEYTIFHDLSTRKSKRFTGEFGSGSSANFILNDMENITSISVQPSSDKNKVSIRAWLNGDKGNTTTIDSKTDAYGRIAWNVYSYQNNIYVYVFSSRDNRKIDAFTLTVENGKTVRVENDGNVATNKWYDFWIDYDNGIAIREIKDKYFQYYNFNTDKVEGSVDISDSAGSASYKYYINKNYIVTYDNTQKLYNKRDNKSYYPPSKYNLSEAGETRNDWYSFIYDLGRNIFIYGTTNGDIEFKKYYTAENSIVS